MPAVGMTRTTETMTTMATDVVNKHRITPKTLEKMPKEAVELPAETNPKAKLFQLSIRAKVSNKTRHGENPTNDTVSFEKDTSF